MWFAVALLLGADPLWTENLGTGRNGVTKVMRPKGSQIKEAFEDLDRAMKLWERERREHLDEQVTEQQRVLQRERDSAPLPEAALKKYKVIEVGKGGTSRKGRSKVIEMPEREKGDAEIERLAAEAQAHREKCKADPAACAREKKERAALERANDAWDQAVTTNFEKRRAVIEAEARKFQDDLNAAKKREEQRQAEKLGGAIDNEGNFVDSDLKDVPQKPDGR